MSHFVTNLQYNNHTVVRGRFRGITVEINYMNISEETKILFIKSCQTAVEGMLFLAAQSIWQLSPIMLTGL